MTKSDREIQLDMLDDLATYWGAMGEGRLRQMQKIAGVLISGEGTLRGKTLENLNDIHAEFCGSQS